MLSSAAPLLAGLSRLQRVELCALRLDLAPEQLEAQWQELRELVLRSVAVGGGGGAGGEWAEEGAGAWGVLPRLPQLTGLTVVAGALRALAAALSLHSLVLPRWQPVLAWDSAGLPAAAAGAAPWIQW